MGLKEKPWMKSDLSPGGEERCCGGRKEDFLYLVKNYAQGNPRLIV